MFNSAEVSPLDINGSLRKDNRYESNPCLFLRYICTPSMKPLDSQLWLPKNYVGHKHRYFLITTSCNFWKSNTLQIKLILATLHKLSLSLQFLSFTQVEKLGWLKFLFVSENCNLREKIKSTSKNFLELASILRKQRGITRIRAPEHSTLSESSTISPLFQTNNLSQENTCLAYAFFWAYIKKKKKSWAYV